MVSNTTNTQNLKKGTVLKNYYGHEGALYKGDIVILKEITSNKLKVTDLSGRLYWVSSDIIKINN
tara:strand:- start:69 stop:263 length:195 start_codon:yes stop_codon:yes gene_type:complete